MTQSTLSNTFYTVTYIKSFIHQLYFVGFMWDSTSSTIKVLLSMAFILAIVVLVLLVVFNTGGEVVVLPGVQSPSIIFYQNQTEDKSLIGQLERTFLEPYIELATQYNRMRVSPGNFIHSSSSTQRSVLPFENNSSSGNNVVEGSSVPGGNLTFCGSNQSFILTSPNFKVAFIGDSGHGDNFRRVLELIRNENVNLVLHQGDLGYDEGTSNTPQLWLDRIQTTLDPSFVGGTFPYFFSIGNHDAHQWTNDNGYREILENRLNHFNISYHGNLSYLGGRTSFAYNGLFVVMVGPGIDANLAGSDHGLFIQQELNQSPYLWNICSWHKDMHAMQAGGKPDETGWDVYEKCREGGGIIATAHEHSYSRTYVLSDMSEQTIADNTNPLTIRPGQTFVFVSGLGGASIRDQENSGDYFASIYTSTQGANYGALFIEFYVDGNPRKAHGYFKNIDGQVVDEFDIYNDRQGQSNCTSESAPSTSSLSSSGFVYANGTKLQLNGDDFRFIGVNVYGAANDRGVYDCGPSSDYGSNPDRYLDSMFSYLNSRGVNAVRFWAFQRFTDGGNDFSSIDRLISYARRYNVRLIPVLENQWSDCTFGGYKFNSWYSGGYLSPYGDYSLSYRNYVEKIVTRYRDEPTILMWQLMNEAESKATDGREDPVSLYNFATNMSQFIKSIDMNHLVSLGTIGTGQPGTENENFYNLHNIGTIDVVEAHDYGHDREAFPSEPYNSIAVDLNTAQGLDKPFFIGEAGIKSNCGSCFSESERASLFDSKISALFENGGVGYLIWQWDNGEGNSGTSCRGFDDYCFTEGDPLLNVIQNHTS